ncbi:MAG: DegT/DnrJ/EryC1/StrS family aminotransferase, partial [Oscillospiraceae bacterium]
FEPDKDNGVKYNYAYLPILVEPLKFGVNRDALYDHLKENNISARKYFHPLTSDFGCYKDIMAEVPVAKIIAQQVLCLPLYYDLELEKVDSICRIIKEAVK